MIDSSKYGVSFSLKQCRNFGLDPRKALDWLLAQGWRRFRLMSYWDEHETSPGTYNFDQLDWQIEAVERAGGIVTLCLGVKQPRWPEYHWPDWAWQLPKTERDKALEYYLEQVVEHTKESQVIQSWQLENEALLRGFGEHIDIDRQRLQREYALVKQLDPSRPIIMSTSNGWGMPVRRPRPDGVGFSFYPTMFKNGAYHQTIQRPWLHRLRSHFVHILLGKQVFIHELQCEPWGPTAIWKMNTDEQAKSMNQEQIQNNITAAQKIGAYPIDLWGSEWWYWRFLQKDHTVIDSIRNTIF